MAEQRHGERRSSRWYTLLGVLIVLMAVAGLLVVIRAVYSLLVSADPTVAAAVVVTSGTVLTSVGSLILSNRFRRGSRPSRHNATGRRRSTRSC